MITTKDPRCHQGAPNVIKGPRCLQTVTSRCQRALTPLITPPNHHRRTSAPPIYTSFDDQSASRPRPTVGFHIFRPVASFFFTLNVCAVANGLSGFVASVSAGVFYLDYTALPTPIGGRPVHWPTTKNSLIHVSSLNRRHLIGKNKHFGFSYFLIMYFYIVT